MKAQAELKNASLNKINPHFRSKYADLAEIRDTVMPTLTKHGLGIIQFTRVTDLGFFLVTRLIHTSGQFIEGEFPLPVDVNKPQSLGSAITYARRYGLSAICGITADEDDDGNAAQENANGGGRKPAARAGGGGGGGNANPADGIVL